jgi:hypothetical protein
MANTIGYTDDVNGIIIGGDYISWQLFYDGRSQSRVEYSQSEQEAVLKASAMVSELKKEFSSIGLFCEDKWEVRFCN